MKNLMKLIFILLPLMVSSQTRWNETNNHQLSAMIGLKAYELSYTYTNDLVYGIAIQAINSNIAEKRANHNDIYHNVHEFNTKVNPVIYGLIGGNFDKFSIIGKLGGIYIDQDINRKKEPQNIYFAVGIIFDQKISDKISLRFSYDNTSGPMIGTSIHF